jgi:hypothetical protein
MGLITVAIIGYLYQAGDSPLESVFAEKLPRPSVPGKAPSPLLSVNLAPNSPSDAEAMERSIGPWLRAMVESYG